MTAQTRVVVIIGSVIGVLLVVAIVVGIVIANTLNAQAARASYEDCMARRGYPVDAPAPAISSQTEADAYINRLAEAAAACHGESLVEEPGRRGHGRRVTSPIDLVLECTVPRPQALVLHLPLEELHADRDPCGDESGYHAAKEPDQSDYDRVRDHSMSSGVPSGRTMTSARISGTMTGAASGLIHPTATAAGTAAIATP